MPLSSKNKHQPRPLAGMPRAISRRAPHGWPPARTARWCRGFVVGASGSPNKPDGRDEIRGFMAGFDVFHTEFEGRNAKLLAIVHGFTGMIRSGRLA